MIRNHPIHRGATNTTTITIVIVVVVLAGLLVVGCIGVMASIMLPAIGQAREQARGIRSATQLRQIDIVYNIWLQDPDRPEPFSFQMLVDGQWANDDLFESPFGPAPDGGDDYWFLHERSELTEVEQSRLIVGYDRTMYATQPRVAVVFGDGEATAVDTAEFERLTGSPPNDQIDFNLPPRQNRR